MLHDIIGLLEEDEITYSWFQKMALLLTQLTTLWNFWIRFLENVSSLETYGPLARRIFLHQTIICGEQHNLQCIVISHARLMS
jgi:hypothetical protein